MRDLGSKNGVVVGGRRWTERLLSDRDEVCIGSTVLLFEDPADGYVKALERGDDEDVEPPTWAEVVPEPEPEEVAPANPEPAPAPSPLAPSKPSIAAADMVIYVLASVVFAVSVLGLIWLLRSG